MGEGYICSLCGKPAKKKTVDHIIPLAVEKWVETCPPLNVPINKVDCCETCNRKKGSYLYTLEQYFQKHFVKESDRKEFSDFFHSVEGSVEEYVNLKRRIANSYNRRCAYCKQYVPLKKANLRRIDWDLPRSPENAYIVCSPRCNGRLSFQKAKEQKKKTGA